MRLGFATIPKRPRHFLRREQRFHHYPQFVRHQLARHPHPSSDADNLPEFPHHRKSVLLEALNSLDVKDVCYENLDGRERLTIHISDNELLVLALKPRIEIQQTVRPVA